VRWRSSSRKHQVVITFDDGPDPAGTPAVLDALAGAGLRATFFVLAERVAQQPTLSADIVAAGHEIGLHADTHEPLDKLPARVVAERLRAARLQVEDIVQRPVTLHRPPYGRVSLAGLRGAARANLRVLLWSEDPEDYRPAPPDALAARIRSMLHPGAVVLLHDGASTFDGQGVATASALAGAIEVVAERGLVACSGSELW
jgi:peptidoglycan/xylan/chitin deacetylase (PgdA/CDA1 family)